MERIDELELFDQVEFSLRYGVATFGSYKGDNGIYVSLTTRLSRAEAEKLRDPLLGAYPTYPDPREDLPAPWEEE